MFSQWDHEMSHGLMVNLSVFTHPTMRFSHGLIVKWPLWIIFTKFFRLSTYNQEQIWWSHVLTVRPWDVSWSLGQPYCFHPPHHEISSWSHGEMTIMNDIHKILQTINMQPGENMMISLSHILTVRPWDVSWSLCQPYCFHPPQHEIFSWSHGEMTIMNNIHKVLQTINMQPGENIMISCSHSETMRCLMVSWSTILFSPTPPWDFLMVSSWNDNYE